MHRLIRPVLCACALMFVDGRASEAQDAQELRSTSETRERIGSNHWRQLGHAEIEGSDFQFFADAIDLFTDTNRLVATGNVVFTSGGSRIAADRAEFDTKTRTGTFFHASGSASLGEQADRSLFGAQEPDVYFYGETVEKIGRQKYRLTKGGFTTCVQPTPRWEITSGRVILNLDHYAILTNSLLKVKGVPVLYLPVFYYPIQEDGRSTGFLMPTYGATTTQGQKISNAFFWAINRSHDATFFHDWLSKTGQGAGAEYRYVRGPGSDGNAQTHFLTERASTYTDRDSRRQTTPARRSYWIRGGLSEGLPWRLRARANVDYTSNIEVQQLYQANFHDATKRERRYGGNVSGAWGAYTLNATVDRRETFSGRTSSDVHGAAPRISFSRGERPIGRLPVYLVMGGEYASLLRENRRESTVVDNGLTRLDASAIVRVPFTRWPFLTVNSSVRWRDTYWTQSFEPATRTQVDAGVSRRYYEFDSYLTGPMLNRVWNTPTSGYAEKLKHVIQPFVTFKKVTAIDNLGRIVSIEAADSFQGGTTNVGYGVINRLYAKRNEGGPAAISREIATLAITQSYYTNPRFAQFDRQYRTSFSGTPPSHYSPIRIDLRASPTREISGTLQAHYDTQFDALREITARGGLALGGWLQTSAGWSQKRFVKGLAGHDARDRLTHALTSETTLRARDNRVGGGYSFYYDVRRRTWLQQRLTGYYNAQCCGFAVEYQTVDLTGLGRAGGDRRFSFSFSLAGLGTFANPFGAFSSVPR